MATEFATILRRQASAATLAAELHDRQWGFTSDTTRIVVMDDDGVTLHQFYSVTEMTTILNGYSTSLQWKDSVSTAGDLAAIVSPLLGEQRLVLDEGNNYYYDGSVWKALTPGGGGGGISAVVDDPNPKLGGNLT